MGSRAIFPAGDTTWMDHGNCVGQGHDTMFPVTQLEQAQAAVLCTGCPVRRDCLVYALDNWITHGVWGGTTEEGRRTLRIRIRMGATTLDDVLHTPTPAPPSEHRPLTAALDAVAALAQRHPTGVTAGYVAKHLNTTNAAAQRRLCRLTETGHLHRIERGLYAAVGVGS